MAIVDFGLNDRVALVTGASRGLGQYCAVQYAKEGAKVVVAARTEQERDPRLPGTIHDTVRMIEAKHDFTRKSGFDPIDH